MGQQPGLMKERGDNQTNNSYPGSFSWQSGLCYLLGGNAPKSRICLHKPIRPGIEKKWNLSFC